MSEEKKCFFRNCEEKVFGNIALVIRDSDGEPVVEESFCDRHGRIFLNIFTEYIDIYDAVYSVIEDDLRRRGVIK